MALYDISARLVLENVDSSSVERAISNVNSHLEKGTRTAKTFSETITLKGINLAAYTALSGAMVRLASFVSSATNDAIKFDKELAKLAQTVGVSNQDIKQHSESIRKMSVAYGLSAPKIAETIRVLAQAGYSLNEAKAAADELAKTTLLASFESIANTTEGLIAINKQFTETVGQSARVLSLLNVVAKKYAVESDDLVDAAKRAGGVFAATGGSLEELTAIYTTVRDTTRESSETISTGLRTIFSRLQRPKTIDYLRQFGIELTDLKGNFIGNYEAIIEIQKGIQRANIQPGSLQFAEIVEQLGGVLQQSRVIPLLTQGAKMQRIYADAQNAASETAADLAKAQETLAFKITQTQQNFSKLIGDIMETSSFKAMVSVVLSLTNAFIGFADSIKELIPLIATLGAIKLARSAFQILPGASLGSMRSPIKRARGGFVPGSGSGDTVPAMLEPGEFVIRKSAAQAFGADALHNINKYGKGPSRTKEPQGVKATKRQGRSSIDLGSIGMIVPNFGKDGEDQVIAGTYNGQPYSAKVLVSSTSMKTDAFVDAQKRLRQSLSSSMKKFDIPSEGISRTTSRLKLAEGQLFEEMVLKLSKMDSPGNDLLDIKQVTSKLNSILDSKLPLGPADIKLTNNLKNRRSTAEKLAKTKFPKNPQKKARGGATSGTDTVPALLTPGEFVVNKESAQAFGYGNLHEVNKYAKGGPVQRFAGGGKTQKVNGVEFVSTDNNSLLDELIKTLKQNDSPQTSTTPTPARVSNREAAVVAESADIQAKIRSRKQQQITDLNNSAEPQKERAVAASSGYEDPASIKRREKREAAQAAALKEEEEAAAARIAAAAEEKARVDKEAKEKEVAAKEAAKARKQQQKQEKEAQRAATSGADRFSNEDFSDIAAKDPISIPATMDKDSQGNFVVPTSKKVSQPSAPISATIPTTGQVANPAMAHFASMKSPAQTTNVLQDTQAKAEAAEKSKNLASTFSTLAFVASGVASQYADQETAMGRGISSILSLVSTISLVTATLSSFGVALNAEGIGNAINSIKGVLTTDLGALSKTLSSRVASMFTSAAASATTSAATSAVTTSVAAGVGGATAGAVAGGATAGGAAAVTTATAAVSASLLTVASAAVTTVAGVYAFGYAVDRVRGLQEETEKQIKAGNSAKAAEAATYQQNQSDGTALSAVFAGLVIVGTALAVGLGLITLPITGTVAAIVALTAVVAGVVSKLISMTGVGSYVVSKFRDLGAWLGILESSTARAAEASSAAAVEYSKSVRERNTASISKEVSKIKTEKDADKVLGSVAVRENAFAGESVDRENKKSKAEKMAQMAQNSANEGGATGARFMINKGLNRITLGWVETYGQANERLMAEMDTLDSKTKEENKASLDLIRPAIDTKMTAFADKGGTDWTIFLDSLDPSARKLILLSGAANDLQNQLEDVKAAAKTEAAIRAILNAQMQKQLITTTGIAEANKKAIAASELGNVVSGLASDSFRGSSLSSAASSEDVNKQSLAAEALGIKGYAENVSAATKGKSEMAKLETAFATATPEKRQAAQDAITAKKREIINATGGDATGLEGEALDKAYESTIEGSDKLKNSLIEAAKNTETAINSYIESVSRASQAQSAYNEAVFNNAQAAQGRQKDLQSFKVGGSTISEIRDRKSAIRTDDARANASRLNFVGTSSRLASTGVKIAQTQAKGDIVSPELANTFAALQIKAKEQADAIGLETKNRQALIEAIKEEMEIEKNRGQTFEDLNLALSGGLGKQAKKEAEKQVKAISRVEEIRKTQGDEAANAQLGKEIDRGTLSRQMYTGVIQTEESQRFNQSASMMGANRFESIAGPGAVTQDSRSVATGRMTERQRQLQGEAASQTSQIDKNEKALLQGQDASLQLLKASADIFGNSIKDMNTGLTGFNSELKNIVSSLQSGSISMKLDTTNVVVDISSPEGLEALSKQMRQEMKTLIADQLLAQKTGRA